MRCVSDLRLANGSINMKYGQPMKMHFPEQRGLQVSDINDKLKTRNSSIFRTTVGTIDHSKLNWAGAR